MRSTVRTGLHTVVAILAALASLAALMIFAPPAEAQTNPLRVTSTCLAGNGRIDVNVVNDGAPAVYTLQVGNLSPRSTTVGTDQWWRSPVTGRPDGPIDVTLTRDGVTVLDETVIVACDTNPMTSTPEIDVMTWCINGLGIIWVQFANPTGFNRTYILNVQGLTNTSSVTRSTSTTAYGATFRGVSGRPNGEYIVAISGTTQYTEIVEVDCQIPTGTIGDLVFEDVNYSGDYDPVPGNPFTDVPLEGVMVELWNAGQLVRIDTTDSNGQYLFENLTLGTEYEVQVVYDTLPFDFNEPWHQTYGFDYVWTGGESPSAEPSFTTLPVAGLTDPNTDLRHDFGFAVFGD